MNIRFYSLFSTWFAIHWENQWFLIISKRHSLPLYSKGSRGNCPCGSGGLACIKFQNVHPELTGIQSVNDNFQGKIKLFLSCFPFFSPFLQNWKSIQPWGHAVPSLGSQSKIVVSCVFCNSSKYLLFLNPHHFQLQSQAKLVEIFMYTW